MTFDRKFVVRELRDLLLFVAIALIQPYFTCPRCTTANNYLTVAIFTFFMWLFLWKGNALLSHSLSKMIPWIHFPVRRLTVGIVTSILYTAGAVIGLMLFFEYAFDFNFGGGFRWTIYFSIGFTIVISSVLHAYHFFHAWRKAIVEAERLQRESITAKYESLKSQVNPHFLFNTLNALTSLVYEDQDKAVKFIKQLSEVYRYVLDTRDREVVSIDDEKKFLDSYLFLQQIRFGTKLRLQVELGEVKSMVAPLVLQMLIENAIKHNIVSEENPLTITIRQEDEFIVVENNLQKKTTLHDDSTGMGLENICKRYEFLSDRKVDISEGKKFTVKLPIIPAGA